MRIVHTSDWHAGRAWKQTDRLEELEAVLAHLAAFIAEEAVDLLLITGDVFDTRTPPARAEQIVFGFLRRIGSLDVRTVMIAGNHDSPNRFEAWAQLAELADVVALGHPRDAEHGGLVEVTTRNGERARIAAVPFASAGTLIEATALADEPSARRDYAHSLGRLFAELAEGFGDVSVNLLLAHTHVSGAMLSGSERRIHVADEWAAEARALPAGCHYAALGHLHKPQPIPGAPCLARYAGSALQLDFGEAGEAKSFVVLDANAEHGVESWRTVPYQGALPLADIELDLVTLEDEAENLRDAGWLRVTVPLDRPDADLARKVKTLLPNAVVVRAALDTPLAGVEVARLPTNTPPAERFAAYFENRHDRPVEPAVLERFRDLYQEALDQD
ncbi:MAG: exonuclease SbcCD subunit D [Acidobacteriota bacterium]